MKRRCSPCLCAGFVLLAAGGCSPGFQPDQAFAPAPEHLLNPTDIRALDVTRDDACTQPAEVEPGAVTVLERDQANEPLRWVEAWRARDCGSARTVRVEMSREADQVQAVALVPGNSRARAELQETVSLAMLAAIPDDSCTDRFVADTRVLQQDGAAGSWSERWTVAACGNNRSFRVDFFSDAERRFAVVPEN